MVNVLARVWRYFAYERNPLVQLIYLSVMFGCLTAFVRDGYPFVPNAYVSAYHKWTMPVLFAACLALYVAMCVRDPGVVRADNLLVHKQYPHHPVLFPEQKYCRTCKTLKLPRSKHCSVCNQCVARFDHHCIWFNGCVGANNYRFFLMFLVVQTALCFYVFLLTSSVFLTMTEPMLGGRRVDGNVLEISDELTAALHDVITRTQGLGFVAAVTFMIGIVVWIFFLIQLYRIAQNVTANETFKREDLCELATMDNEASGKQMFNFLFERMTFGKKPRRREKRNNKDLDSSWGGMFTPDTIMNTEENFSAADVKFNPYDRKSFWKNLLDAFQIDDYAPVTDVKKSQ